MKDDRSKFQGLIKPLSETSQKLNFHMKEKIKTEVKRQKKVNFTI